MEEINEIPAEEIMTEGSEDENSVSANEEPVKSEELIAAEKRTAFLEAKLFCIENGIHSDFAEDVITLAQSTAKDNDINSAILSVAEKYPFFRKEKEKEEKRNLTTGIHIEANRENPCGGVEAAFKRSNPYVKL